MATSKTLAPTNVTISIPAMADAPDASVFSNCVDKEADAINALNSQLKLKRITKTYTNLTLPSTDNPYVQIDDYNGLGVNTGYYLVSMIIRGWSNTHVGNMSLVKSSNGSEFYVLGSSGGNIGTITVEYFFATTVDTI